MELTLNNPFRVLGLSATATSRDIAKRISDLETFAELGKAKSFPLDFPRLGPLDRSIDAIKDAARKIEQTEGRIFYSFFWFRIGDSVDELALDSLASGSAEIANELWVKQLAKKGSKKYTWRLNKSILHLINACRKKIDISEMDKALENLGFVIDDDLEESVRDVLAGNDSGLNQDSLWRRVVDEIVAIIQSSPNNPYGNNAIKVLDSLWSFPEDAREYAASKILNPLIEKVNDAIKLSEDIRSNDDIELLKKKNKLDQVENIIWEIKEVLGEDDTRFQTVANAFADEVCACAVKALNDFKKPKLSMELILWADSLPSFSRIKVRIVDNLDNISSWLEDDEEDEIFGEIVKKIKLNVFTLTQAATLLEDMKRLLAEIKLKVGGSDKRYLTSSSACAHHILEFLIDTVNSAHDTFKNTKNLTDLRSTISGATGLTRKLLLFDLDVETRARVNKNLATISGMNDRLTSSATTRASQSNDAGGFFEQIPSWLWIVGIISLLSMCSGM